MTWQPCSRHARELWWQDNSRRCMSQRSARAAGLPCDGQPLSNLLADSSVAQR